MFGRLLASTAFFALAAGGLVAQDDKKPDTDKVEGEWAVVSMETGGKKMDEEGLKKRKLVVKGDEWLTTVDGKTQTKMTAKLDPSKSPKEVDFKVQVKDPAGEPTLKGIYKLDGDTLTVCRAMTRREDRPKEFKAGNGVMLVVYKRVEKK